jgi:hypothetical protein
MSDFFPQSYKNEKFWLTKQKTDIAGIASTIGMTAAEQTAFIAAIDSVLPTVTAIVDLMDQLDVKVADLQPLLDNALPVIRATIKRAKTSPGCTPGIITDMEWAGDSSSFDPATARPTITAEAQRSRVKIDGRKPGFEAVNLYSRKKGEVQWKLIAVRKRKFPYYDETPLAVAGTPEVREYMAIGVIADEEIGQPSEIKEVVYAG